MTTSINPTTTVALAKELGGSFTLRQAADHFQVTVDTARYWVGQVVKEGALEKELRNRVVHFYVPTPEAPAEEPAKAPKKAKRAKQATKGPVVKKSKFISPTDLADELGVPARKVRATLRSLDIKAGHGVRHELSAKQAKQVRKALAK